MDPEDATGLPNRLGCLSRDAVGCIVEHADCVVFDFHRTLCSDLFFRPLGESVLAEIQPLLWGPDQGLLDRWMTGQVRASEIAGHLARHLGIPAVTIELALREGCRELVLNRAVWEFAQAVRAAGKRVALVTVNMDVFSEEVVPSHGLHRVFEVIVNSADHGTTDKLRLWPIAFGGLGTRIGYAHSFLIEDGEDSPRRFTQAGGKAYQYRDDVTFRAWLDQRRVAGI